MPPLAAGALVFFTSGAVLVLEILAARLLAPYVGVTLETYTGIIGTVLAGIAAGTWIGGRAADRTAPRQLLGPLLVVGGILAILTIPAVRAVGPAVAAVGTGGRAGPVLLLSATFLIPAAVLSAVTPVVVKVQLQDLARTGEVVGRLSALGTAGAIAGTFLAGFVLVEAAPTPTSITIVGGGLVLAGVATWADARRTAVAPPVAGLLLLAGGLAWTAGDVCHVETTYHCARVETDPARQGGRLLILDTLRHSYVDLDDPEHLEFRYIRLFAATVAGLRPAGPLSALHVGGGGFTMPRWLAASRPGSTSTVLEVDEKLVALDRQRLGLRTGPDLHVRLGDARMTITAIDDNSADVVFGDAFGGLAVPWHLTTTEFVAEVRRVLTRDGFYVMNVIDDPPFRFARAEAATLGQVFEHVVVLVPPGFVDGRAGGNVVLVASGEPLDRSGLRAGVAALGSGEVVVDGAAFAADAPVLTDAWAPVDQWLARAHR